MKKLNYLLLGAAGLLMASCANDDLQAPGSNVEGNYKVKVKLPADLGTRAVDMNTGYTAENLNYAVYDAADGSLVTEGQTTFGNALETEVGFNLATGKSYQIAFFASAPNNGVYTFNAEGKIMSVDYEAMTDPGTEQNDLYDCFINLLETNEIGTSEVETSIVLYRPIAQINWGTSDYLEPAIEKAYGEDLEYVQSTLKIESAYTTWSLLGNDVITDETSELLNGKPATTGVTFTNFTQPVDASEAVAGFPVNGYEYVTMQYVLAPREESALYNLNIAINNGNRTDEAEVVTSIVNVSAAPVQANYRTNIYGTLLTDNLNIHVVKDPNWFTPGKNFELIDGQQYMVITQANGGAVKNGGNFILGSNVVYPSANTYIPLTKSSNINLNGFSLTSQGYKPTDPTKQTGDAIVVGSGATVKISNGTLLPATVNAFEDGSSATINLMTATGGQLTLDDVNVVGDMYPVMMTSTNPSANITINGGNFTFTDKWTSSDIVDKQVCVYIDGAGTAIINGGTFGMPGIHSEYLLNVKDDKRNGRQPNQIITVYGGTFINFDPSNNRAEGVGTNFVADGYKVVSSTRGNDTYYTVVPESTVAVDTQDELENAINNGEDVVLSDNISISTPNQSNGYGATGIAIKNGQTFDGNGNTFGVPGANTTWASAISTTGGTIKNLTINKGFRGIFICHNSSYSAPVILENVILDGVTYTISCDQGSNQGLTATNCTFNGWTSYAATLGNTTFINCNFGKGNGYAFMRPYAATVLRGCNFAAGFTIDAQASVTFENCTFNGAPLTNANLSQLVTSNAQNAVVLQ